MAQRAGRADALQLQDAVLRVDTTLQADDRVELEQPERRLRAVEVDLARGNRFPELFRQCVHVHLQSHSKRSGRTDGGRDHLVHAQGIGPLGLVAEGVVSEDVSSLRSQLVALRLGLGGLSRRLGDLGRRLGDLIR